jgi:D-3-phosphoglycerate dehydrogenase
MAAMQTCKVLYVDTVFDEFKKVLERHVPSNLQLLYLSEMDDQQRHNQLADTDFLLVATQPVSSDMINAAKKLKLIQKTGIGVDNINLETATQLGIPVCNTPGGNAAGVAELTILLILALYRKLIALNEATKTGNWLMWELRPHSFEMHGKTHGLIGFVNIAKKVAKRSQAFGTRIVYYDVFRLPPEQEEQLGATYLPLEKLLETSDIISVHVPLLPATRHLIGKEQFARMKESAVLINVSRGHIVDEEALFEALQNKQIAGAGIDVWAAEPVNPDNPLLALDNVLATPHIGAGTRDTLDRVLSIAFANIIRVADGELPEHQVNKQ